MTEIIYKELSYRLNGLFFKTHNELGRFRAEKTYADYFENLLVSNEIEYNREKALPAVSEGQSERRDIADFIIENKIILDFKAKQVITKEDYFQMKRYLRASKLKLGIIVNFRPPHIFPKRIAA